MITSDTDPLGTLFLDAAARHAQRVALRTPDRDITYAGLRSMAAGLALQLQGEGVGRDSLIGLDPSLRDDTEILLSILAVTLLGARWMMYSVYPEGLPLTLTHLLHADPRHVPRGRMRSVDVAPLLERIVSHPGVADPCGLPGYLSADDTWALSASSGTTGMPKCLRISSRNMADCVLRFEDYVESPEGLRAAVLFPRNSYAHCIFFFRALHIGATLLLHNAYPFLADQHTDVVIGSPAHVAALLDGVALPARPVFGEVRVSGAAMSPPFLSRLLKFSRSVGVGYGATEVGAVCSRRLQQDEFTRSVGRCHAGARVEIVDERDHALGAGSEGIVRIRTSSHSDGYLGDEEATAQAFRDGWFYPGDRGYLSPEGELFITGRVQDHLNAGGLKVDAVAVDEIMHRTEGVADALCFSGREPAGAGRLAALVAIEPGRDPQSVAREILKSFLRSPLHASVYPREIYQVDQVPRNANGKPMRHRAQELAEGMRPLARFGARRSVQSGG